MSRLFPALVAALLFATPAFAMNKKEMAAKLAKEVGISQAKAGEVITAIFDARPGAGIIATELDAGRTVQIPGFGTFGSKKFTGDARFGDAHLSVAGATIPGGNILKSALGVKTGLEADKAAEVITAIFDARPGKGIIASAIAEGDSISMPTLGFSAELVDGKLQATLTAPEE